MGDNAKSDSENIDELIELLEAKELALSALNEDERFVHSLLETGDKISILSAKEYFEKLLAKVRSMLKK